jgi:hypothetical protein
MHYFWYYCSASLTIFRLCLNYFFCFCVWRMCSLCNIRIYVHCPVSYAADLSLRRCSCSCRSSPTSRPSSSTALDYPRIPLVPSAITPCALDLLYLFLRAVSSQSSAENGCTHSHKHSLTILRDGSLVFILSAPALRRAVSVSPDRIFNQAWDQSVCLCSESSIFVTRAYTWFVIFHKLSKFHSGLKILGAKVRTDHPYC